MPTYPGRLEIIWTEMQPHLFSRNCCYGWISPADYRFAEVDGVYITDVVHDRAYVDLLNRDETLNVINSG